jgi:imidazolonepropionase-like amidohydrolase
MGYITGIPGISRTVVRVAAACMVLLPAAMESTNHASENKDVSSARILFQRNLDAIQARDRQAYLDCYWQSEKLARTGFGGMQLGYEDHAKQSSDDSWPDLFEARDLQLVALQPGVVYGSYRYRVHYGKDEQTGISERLFLKTEAGWKIAVTTAFSSTPGTPPPPRVLTGATLVDGNGGAPIPNSVVVTRNGKIECAGTREECPVPDNIEATDLTGDWIAPGLVDAHVHFAQTGWADGRPDSLDRRKDHPYAEVQAGLRANPERWFRSYICSGITAVFDVGGYPWSWGLPSAAENDTRAPHVVAAGPLLSTMDFWLNLPGERQFIHLKDEASGREGVRYLASHGAGAVKVWFIVTPNLDFSEMAASVMAVGDEARKLGIPMIVHATGLKEAKVSLRAGAALLVHSVQDEEVDDEFISLAKDSGVVYCPTLTVLGGYPRMYESASSGIPPVIDDPLLCVDEKTLANVRSTASIPKEEARVMPLDMGARSRSLLRTMSTNLRKIHDAGITVATGTDAGNPLTLHGPSIYAEMEAMVSAGMSPMDVLVASTRNGAVAMGRGKDLGTIENGKLADMVVLDGDPTESISNFRKLKMVIRGGELRTIDELRVRSRAY